MLPDIHHLEMEGNNPTLLINVGYNSLIHEDMSYWALLMACHAPIACKYTETHLWDSTEDFIERKHAVRKHTGQRLNLVQLYSLVWTIKRHWWSWQWSRRRDAEGNSVLPRQRNNFVRLKKKMGTASRRQREGRTRSFISPLIHIQSYV